MEFAEAAWSSPYSPSPKEDALAVRASRKQALASHEWEKGRRQGRNALR